MSGHRGDLVERVRAFQLAVNTLAAGAVKTAMQAELDGLILAIVAAAVLAVAGRHRTAGGNVTRGRVSTQATRPADTVRVAHLQQE